MIPATIKRFLRRPAMILGELATLAAAGALGATLPQLRVFQSPWFAAVAWLAAASLAVVIVEQFRRVRTQWRPPLAPTSFQSAPFQAEFERPATRPNSSARIWSERRLGVAGSLVFHVGLLCLIVAGALRALFATDAIVDLMEGETLAPTAAAWSAQWPGRFAKPFQLDQPVTLESVTGRRYSGGDLRELKAKLSIGEIAVNHQLRAGGGKIYLAQEFGPAALLEWNSTRRAAALLAGNNHGSYEGVSTGPAGLKVFLRSDSERPAKLEVRVMRGGGLLAAGSLNVGETLMLPDRHSLTLRGVPMWARLQGSRDSALWLAYFGMILTMAGAAMIFTLIKLDLCIAITPLGERERVFIALKPQRFAPLFQERFERLICEESSLRSGVSAERRDRIRPDAAAPCRRAAALLWLVGGLALTSGCNRVTPTQARQLVERYNQAVSEAYRRGDVRLVDPVVGLNEGKKITGLIGVRLDLGLTLDSQLQSLEITGVEQAKAELRIHTKERWTYRNLKIGTGEPVGQSSQDAYEMTYFFTNANQTWLVDEIKFAAPPQVGRTNTPWVADRALLHGTTVREATP